ncbi:hypothetical protein LSH36_1037g00060, partial [Paralvinella palmiformis]
YLSHYEKVHHFGEDPDRIRDDQLDDNSIQARKKTTGPVGGVPMSYNYGQHNIPDHIRQSMGLKVTKHLVSSGEYKNLVHSLMCGLPNEVDFALNICTLLSNEGQHTIELQKCPHILKLLLAHMGIYGHDHESLYMLHEQGWKNYTKRKFSRFWYDSVRDKEIRKFLTPGCLQVSKSSPDSVGDDAMDGITEITEEQHNEDNDPDLANVFTLDRDLGIHDIEGQRVLQLAMIIRNLSFEKENMKILSKDVATFRFLMLCIHSKYNALRQLALDTLSNIALEMVLSPFTIPMIKLVFQHIAHCIASPDKFDIISGLDTLARLCQVEANEEVICDNLEDATYENIVHLLTIHDIQLIVYSLETLYQLSELGEVTTTHIAAIRMAVETLVNLVTVEAQAYGPESLVGIRVVEHITAVPVTGEKIVPTASQTSIQQQMAVPQPATSIQPESKSAQTAHIGIGLLNNNFNKYKKPASTPIKRAPFSAIPIRPGPVITPPPVTPSPAALTKAAVQPLKTQPELDSDTLACNWLQAYYEFIGTDNKGVEDIPKMELYGEFLTTCGRLFIKNIANASCFANCVRMTFSKVESVRIKRTDGTTEQIYRGLKKRDLPLPFPPNTDFGAVMPPIHGLQRAPAANTGSPQAQFQHSNENHLKQQYVAPHSNQLHSPPLSPTRYPQTVTSTGSSISPTHYPTIQQALLGGRGQDTGLKLPVSQSIQQTLAQGTNSTLIKSLLANKVSQNISRQQGEQVLTKHGAPLGQPASQHICQGVAESFQEPGFHLMSSVTHQAHLSLTSSSLKAIKNKNSTSPPGTPTSKSKSQPRFRSSKNRNNGHDVVITDSKTIEDLIESVARQGSVESDDDKDDNIVQEGDDDFGFSGPDVSVMQEQDALDEGSSDKNVDRKPEADGNNRVKTKLSASGDAALPSVNGTNAPSSSELNGNRLHLNLANVTSCRVVIDKAKPQHILNGAIHHLGNGSYNKLTKAKTKDLENVNSKICESQPVVNSQSEACIRRDSSVRTVIGSDEEEMKTGTNEMNKEILENGFTLPVSEKGYEVPQLDGTVDEEAAKLDATSTSTQQNSNIPQVVSSGSQALLRAGEIPVVTPASVTVTASQTLPVKMVYTQGLVTPGQLTQSTVDSPAAKIQPSAVQSPIQRLTSAGRTVTYVPQAAQAHLVHGQPQVVRGQPQVIHGQAQIIRGQPQVVQGQPQVVQGQPQVVQAQPQVVQSQLQVVQGQSQVVQGQRQVIQGQPQVAQGQPQVAQGQPQVAQGQPQVAQSQPQVAQGQPQAIQVSVQQVSSHQPQSSQAVVVQAPSQISVQATRFVLPQGQMAVRPQVSVHPISSQYTQVQQQQATTTVQSQPQIVQSQASVQPQTATSQTQVLQSQVRPQLVQAQAVSQPGQPQVIQQTVRTHLVQQPHLISTHGQPQVLAPTQVMQQHFLQQRQLMQQCQVSQQGQVIQPIQGQNVVVSGQSQAQLGTQTMIQRPQYIQNQVVSGHLPAVTTQSQLLQGQPQVIQTQAQFLQKGQLVQPGSTPQLIQQTTASGAKVTVMVPSQQQLLQYQQAITSQQQLIQKQLATSIAQQPVTSLAQPAVTAPTIQIPVSQLTLPLSQSPAPQPTSVTSSPVSTPPPPSPQSSKASLPSPNTLSLNKKKRPAPTQLEKCFKKKKPMTNITDSRPLCRNQISGSQPSPIVCNKYHCEWAGCKQWFDTIKLFNRHVIKEHFEKQHQQAVCKWEGCDGLRRPKWSLMTHLQDRHLNDTSLKNPAKKPDPTPHTSNIPKAPPPVVPSGGASSGGAVPVYPDNAAIQAIRRFAAKPPFPEFVVCMNYRYMLKKHEERLSFVALSAVEASSPIANCLWELHQTDPH